MISECEILEQENGVVPNPEDRERMIGRFIKLDLDSLARLTAIRAKLADYYCNGKFHRS